MNIMLDNEDKKSEYLDIQIDLSFTTEAWRKLIVKKDDQQILLAHRYLEICIFSHLTEYLNSGDIFIDGAESFSDYRKELLSWNECLALLSGYCKKINIPNNAKDFVNHIRTHLIKLAEKVDCAYPEIEEFIIDDKGVPTLKRRDSKKRPPSAIWLAKTIKERMPERNLLDILCSTHHYTGWAHRFGPISGSDPKIENSVEKYIYTNFAYGSGMEATQAAQHIKTYLNLTAHILSWINRRHITAKMLDQARELLINCANTFPLILAWGDGKSCAADGNLRELREENLITEFHVRYGKKGGIAYHHVADNYIALFSTFIPCGVWEAVAIIEGLLKNKSDVQPNTIHADTQGQSTIVFAVAYLLGFKLMPRIRHYIVDETNIIAQLKNEGYNIKKEDAKFLSPYFTSHIKRYGDYIVDMNQVPKDITVSRSLVLWQ